AGVCAPARDRFPGYDRELQRLVASQGLVALSACQPGGRAGAFSKVRRCLAQAASGADRSRPGSPRLPCRVATQSQEAAPWPGGLSAAKQPQQRGSSAGEALAAGPGLAQPPGSLRSRSQPRQDSLLHPAAQGADQSAPDPGSGVPASRSGLPGLIGLFGIYWQMSTCAQISVRDQLALTLLYLS